MADIDTLAIPEGMRSDLKNLQDEFGRVALQDISDSNAYDKAKDALDAEFMAKVIRMRHALGLDVGEGEIAPS